MIFMGTKRTQEPSSIFAAYVEKVKQRTMIRVDENYCAFSKDPN